MYGLPLPRDLVPGMQLAPASGVDRTVDGDLTGLDGRTGLTAVVDESGELEELPESDHVVPDLHVHGRIIAGGRR